MMATRACESFDLQAATICDLTLPFLADLMGREAALERFHAQGVTFVSVTIAHDAVGTAAALHNIAGVKQMVSARRDRMMLVKSVADIRAAKSSGKLGIGFHFQGSRALEDDPNLVSVFYDLGVRHMLLAYNLMNSAAGGCHERVDAGLSRYGQRLVAEMNQVGMILDCTHTGYRATMEIIEGSSQPTMFSHSNAKALFDHERNITDEQAKACAAKGGVVGVTGVGKFLGSNGTAEVADIVPHILYFAELIGPDAVALGIDNVYYLDQHYQRMARNSAGWSKNYPPPPWHYFAPEQLPELADTLLARGLSEGDLRGILGENFLRLASQVWK